MTLRRFSPSHLLLLSGVTTLMMLSCAGEDPLEMSEIETAYLALLPCEVNDDCDEAPACTVGKCSLEGCRFIQTDNDCCVDDTDCNFSDPCLKGTCIIGPEELEGACNYVADPAKPGCCNYPFQCDLPPSGYVALCEKDLEAGYNKCDYIVDPESCIPPLEALIINEFMANPAAADDSTGEWLELYNPSLEPLYLNGYRLMDADADDFIIFSASPIVVPPGSYFLLGRSDNAENNGGIYPDHLYYNFTLSNGTDEIILVNPQGLEIDRVEYGPPDFATVEGVSYELVNPYMDNNDVVNWRPADKSPVPGMDKGTPGAANTDDFFFYYTPVICNDNNSCTLDTCGDFGEARCLHQAISECCLHQIDCEDQDLCTIDTCKPANLECIHTPSPGCCNKDADCPPYSACTYAECKNHQCRYHVVPEKPGCCVVDVDCKDANPCTIDFCSQEPGNAYKTCHHSSPGGTQCCMIDLECEDGTNDTLDYCLDHECEHLPNPEFCAGPPPAYCVDDNPCTADSCNLATNLCLHTPIEGCCEDNVECDDQDPCTDDYCQAAVHTCAHSTMDGCCHYDDDCIGFLTDQDLCKSPVCVNSECRLLHVPDLNCCLTNLDCDDGDACTDDVCNPGNNTCSNLPQGKGCCKTVADCVADDDPCTNEACVENQCQSTAVAGCCKGAWECQDDDPCTVDACLDYACRYLVVPASNCCLEDGDCPVPCSPCEVATCTPGHYCVVTAVEECTIHPNYTETFSCPGTLATAGWTQTESELGSFALSAVSTPLGKDPAARLEIDTELKGGSICLVSPLVSLLHPEQPHALTFEQFVAVNLEDEELPSNSGSFSVRAYPLGAGEDVVLATFDGNGVNGSRPTMIALPPKVKEGSFQLRFCVEANQGSTAMAWTIDSIKVGTGSPPRILTLPQDVAMLPGHQVTLWFDALDDDDDSLAFFLAGPQNSSLGLPIPLEPEGVSAPVTMAPPEDQDLGTNSVLITVSDGFFSDKISFSQTVYIPQCEGSEDCDDGNYCTDDFCNPITGCTHEFLAGCCNVLTPCDDEDLCTADECVESGCVFSPVVCDDDNLCTTDECKPDKGCLYPFNNEECEDGSVCTWHDVCYKGTCIGLPIDCSDNLSCTIDSCDDALGCFHKSACSDSILCTTDVCTLKGCKSGKVPVGSPIADGVLGEDWPESSFQGTGQFAVGNVQLLLDEVNLYVGLTIVPLGDRAGVLYLDTDFSAETGPTNLADIVGDDSGMDLSLAPPIEVDFPGFGVDLVIGFLWGEDPAQGLVAAGCFQVANDGAATSVPCLVAVSAEGIAEVVLPWYLIFDEAPYEDEVVAMVAAAVDASGAIHETVPPSPLGTVSDLMIFGVPDPLCLISFCGDGIVDAEELCDDGADNSDLAADACRTNCVPAHCGDEVVDSGEECDDGPLNGDAPDLCRTTCLLPFCGDAIVDTVEGCDWGEDNSDSEPDSCRTDCSPAGCGDGVIDSLEGCDDGEANSDLLPDACRSDCQAAWCGDGTVDSDEGCDDGPFNSDLEPDACRSNCQNPWCGDGIQDGDEECDLGEANNDEIPNDCRTDCKWAYCGDGVIDDGEECDDHNGEDWDGCQADCTIYITVCGDGVKTPNEECDWGDDNSDTLPDACRKSCLFAYCGDGVLDANESCDDGNQEGGDECGLDCKPYVPFCGNSWTDEGEECDDGPDNSNSQPDHCRLDCKLPSCGDNVIDSGEECDKGGNNSDTMPNACRTSCLLAWCGDNVADAGEECDDGPDNENAADKCKPDCVAPKCGDGILDESLGEECDWAEFNDDDVADSCRTDCKAAYCGDGTLDSGEECDDGIFNSDSVKDACRMSCQPAWCGDGVIDSDEECDEGLDNQDAPNSCKTYCETPKCGDGIIDDAQGEECDWADFASDLEPDACRTSCQNPGCGDLVIDSNEECDDGNDILGDGCAPDCTIETYVPDPGDIIITEIMQNPAKVYDTLGEYFEVRNTRNFDIDVNGWEISDGGAESHVIVNGAPLLVPANGFLLLGIEASLELNGGVAVDYQYDNILLGNGSDELMLSYKGAISDSVAWDGGPLFPDPKGASMNLAPNQFNHTANDIGAAWCEATTPLPSGDFGTPGQANDLCP